MARKKGGKLRASDPRNLKSQELAEQAMRLRCAGMTFYEIGKAMSKPTSNVEFWIKRALKDLMGRIDSHAEEIRAIMIAQTDEIHRRWWPMATGYTDKNKNYHAPDKNAVDRILRTMDRKMKLLGIATEEGKVNPDLEARAMRDKAAVLGNLTLTDLMAHFTDIVRAPVLLESPPTIEGNAKVIPAKTDDKPGKSDNAG